MFHFRTVKTAALLRNLSVAFVVFTLLVLATPLTRWLAKSFCVPDDPRTGNVLVVFGGGEEMSDGVLPFDSYLRCVHAAQMWKTGKFKRIIVSGGGLNRPVSASLKDFLVSRGIPSQAIDEESRAENTYENVVYTSRLLRAGEVPTLVTSDYHMRRARLIYLRINQPMSAAPVADAIRRSADWKSRFAVAEDLLLEAAKLIYYKIKRYL